MAFVIGLFVGTFVGMMIAGLCRGIAMTEIEPGRREQIRAVTDFGNAA